ncbi:16S rRNA (guanine(527)-N(7))-methyltransferase RsmG [uncultured Deinococcus sp.]|uniref:16S rRNA (guanine(527)-N(7))-methyltransferase RsmG n=1 Tax=uncultured Deinococcus sp. TaxID=158789 RepID=UPI002587577B|nr:16S rRNA (guanine(527)-N(7))-methyltransferase RsmG [uncultured Deinococcus sp.]
MTPEGETLLLDGGRALGLDLAPHLPAFAELLRLLQEGNTRLNLTALKTERDIVLKHFIDSLSCLRGGDLGEEGLVLDLGTGAGFPSLPLAIVRPGLDLVPLDSIGKKIRFVEETAQSLGLRNVRPQVGRAEALGRQDEHRGQYDRVVARAVAALPILAELALPLLRVGGRLVAQKGPITDEELRAGQRAAGEVGGQVQAVDAFELPLSGDARTLIVVTKTRPTPAKYPRREGIPNAQPLFWTAK